MLDGQGVTDRLGHNMGVTETKIDYVLEICIIDSQLVSLLARISTSLGCGIHELGCGLCAVNMQTSAVRLHHFLPFKKVY